MPLEEVKDMTWADFQLRSFQYWEDRKREELLFREVAYMGYCGLFAWSKERPKSKDVFWPIGEKKKGVSRQAMEHFKRIRQEYKESKK